MILKSISLRIGGMLLTLWLASLLVFFSTAALPEDAAQMALGRKATPELLEVYRHAMGLDQGPVTRYVDWLGGILRLDFGRSYFNGTTSVGAGGDSYGAPISSVISQPLINSGILLLATLVLLVPLSFAIGTAAALLRDTVFDRSAQTVTLAFTAVPEFTLGAVLVLVFGLLWPILPAVSFDVTAESLVLPVATLTLTSVAYTARLIRAGVVEALGANHVQMARLKGLPERAVIVRHVLPNAVGATLQAFALVVGALAGGVVIVEYLFAYPGMGSGLVAAISQRDVPVVQAYTLIVAAVFVIANTLADVLSLAFNPRLREPA